MNSNTFTVSLTFDIDATNPADAIERFCIYARSQPHEAFHVTQTSDKPALTPNEAKILSLLSLGWTNPEIATKVNLCIGTVKFHIANLFGKIGAANRAELVRRAIELDLIELV